jgi:hypothetical protein
MGLRWDVGSHDGADWEGFISPPYGGSIDQEFASRRFRSSVSFKVELLL